MLMSGIGSLSRVGGWGATGGVPVLEKAPDFAMNSVRAVMPSFVPRMTGRAIDLEALVRMLRCWLYRGHSLRICSLDSGVSSSHGHVVGSGERGRKNRRNSPV